MNFPNIQGPKNTKVGKSPESFFPVTTPKLINGETNYELIKQKNLGRQLKLQGKVVKNDLFDRTEFIINTLEEANPEEIIKDLK